MKREAGVILATAWALLFIGSAAAFGAQTVFPLPFSNAGSAGSSNSLWQQITNNNYPTTYAGTSNDFRRFRGAFTANAATTKLAIHSDDGSRVTIIGVNGSTSLDFYGENTHFQNSSALRLVPFTFVPGEEYCVQVDYTNNLHNTGDIDGVTLYAYDGGGSARDGIAVWGPSLVCLGNSITLNCCGDSAFTWMNSAPGVVSMSANGSGATLQSLAPGTATITATDGNGKSASRTVKVVRLGIAPSYLETCEGLTHTFIITNADVTSGVVWNPTGSPSANGRTNTYNFSTGIGLFSAGTNTITASWNGCTATATAVVVQAASLIASTNKLCVGGQVIYTAQSAPTGFEHFLNWSGEGLTGVGPSRTNTYGTSGVKTVTVTCGTSTRSVNVTVHKADITNSVGYGLAGSSTPANFYLSADSVGPFTWEISPLGGPSVSEGSVTIPAGTTPGIYTVKVYPSGLPSCSDTATLQVVQVTLSADPIALCVGASTNLGFSVNPSSALSLLTFDTVTNTSFGPANTHASVSVNNTNLTVTGGQAGGTAYLRVKLGTTTLIGPTITIVQVTFPPEAWYVGVGKSADFNVTIVPSNAPVTFDTASPGVVSVSPITGGVRVTGVAPGTNQIRAKIPSGAACSTKQVIAVRVEFPVNELTICNGNIATVPVIIDPPASPVTFSARNPNIVQVTAQGTNLTITMLADGKTTVEAKIGGTILAEMRVRCGTISFPTNAWLALRGIPQEFEFTLSPELSASELTFSNSNPNIATLAVGSPSGLLVTGLTNGTTQISASIEPGQFCVAKAVTIFSAQLQSIEFTSDHNLICNGANVLTAGSRYPAIEWNPASGINAPITHTAGATSRVAATVALAVDGVPGGTVMALKGESSEAALRFGATNSYAGSGTYSIFVQGLSPLGKEIRIVVGDIAWRLEVAGNTLALANSGPHTNYTTLGTPITSAPLSASVPNVPRMEIAVRKVAAAIAAAGSAPDAYTCYPRIVKEVMHNAGKYDLEGVTLEDVEAWLLPKFPGADCISIARFVRNVCMVEGIPGTFASKTYAGLYKTTDAYRQSDPGESAYAGQNPLLGANRPLTALEGSLCVPSPITKDSYGPTVTAGVDPSWQLRLIDSDCVNLLDATAVPGTVGCGPKGVNCFEAAVVYTEPSGNKTWYMAAGTNPLGVWFEDNTTSAPNQDRHGRDNVLRVFVTLAWCAWEDPPGIQPLGWYIKKVEHIYTPVASNPLCP